jgi:hypothetical protein
MGDQRTLATVGGFRLDAGHPDNPERASKSPDGDRGLSRNSRKIVGRCDYVIRDDLPGLRLVASLEISNRKEYRVLPRDDPRDFQQ